MSKNKVRVDGEVAIPESRWYEIIDRFTRIDEELDILIRQIDLLNNQLSGITGIQIPQTQQSKIRLSVNFLELFTTLIYKGLMKPHVVGYAFTVPPNFTLTLNIQVPPDKVSIASEWRMTIDRDHIGKMSIYWDDVLVYQDNDLIQATYNTPVNFFNLRAIIPIERSIRVAITNTSTTYPLNINILDIYADMDKTLFNRILNKYFDTILLEAGYPEAYTQR